jgi:hypothetical protein
VTFQDLLPLIVFLSTGLVLVSAAVGAYFLSSPRMRKPVRIFASWVAAVVSALLAVVVTLAFAIPVLEDLHNPEVPGRTAVMGALIVWAICLATWAIAIRRIVSALRRTPD